MGWLVVESIPAATELVSRSCPRKTILYWPLWQLVVQVWPVTLVPTESGVAAGVDDVHLAGLAEEAESLVGVFEAGELDRDAVAALLADDGVVDGEAAGDALLHVLDDGGHGWRRCRSSCRYRGMRRA